MSAPLRFSRLLAAVLLACWSAAAPAKSLWQKSCTKKGCSAEQVIHGVEPAKPPLLRVRLTPDSQPDQARLYLGAPEGVLLPAGISLSVDGSKPIVLPYLRCVENECGAEAVLNFDALSKVLQGKLLTVHYAFSPQQGVDVPIKLDGLDIALQSSTK